MSRSRARRLSLPHHRCWLRARATGFALVAALLPGGRAVEAVVDPVRAPTDAPGAAQAPPASPLASLATGFQALPEPPVLEPEESPALAGDPAASAFAARLGGTWRASYDGWTGRPVLLSGGGIAVIPGPGNALPPQGPPRLEDLERAVRSLLSRTRDLHGVADGELDLSPERSGAHEDGRLWLLDFDRVVGGVPVQGSRVYARINSGNLIQLGFERLFPVAAEDTRPGLDPREAEDRLFSHIAGREPGDAVLEPGTLLVRPYRAAGGHGYTARLAYRIAFRRPSSPGTWTAYVDARGGELLELYDANLYISGRVTGLVHPRTVTEPEVERPFPFQTVRVQNQNVSTDASGTYTSNRTGNVTFTLGGLRPPGGFSAVNACGPEATFTNTSQNPVIDHRWTNTDSRADERNAFYHQHVIRSLASRYIAPAWIGTVVTTNVCMIGTCNAYWDGSTTNFFPAGGGCNNTGQNADVIMHEWGHGLDQNHGGAADGASGEGIGDVCAMLVTRDPLLGPGFQDAQNPPFSGPMDDYTALRDASKLISRSNIAERCPRQATGCNGPLGYECHCEGIIFSGAAWDLAQLLTARYGADPAYDTLARLLFVSLPTWSNYLQAADAFLAVDDDNGNLNDGTPNGCLIYQAFNGHGIAGRNVPCSRPFAQLALSAQAVLDPTGDGDGVADPGERVALRLTVANKGNASTSTATVTVSTGFTGITLITPSAPLATLPAGASADTLAPHVEAAVDPGVPCGALVPFDVTIRDGVSVYTGSFQLVIGNPGPVLYSEGFEGGAGGWTGNTGSAATGQWIAGTPTLTAIDGDVWQPGQAAQGTGCYYTGANATWNAVGTNDVDGGTALAQSPLIDLRGAASPVLQFWYWYTSLQVKIQPADVLEVELTDGSVTARPFRADASRSAWRFASIPLTGVIGFTNQVRIRFRATDDAAKPNLVEAAVDDVRIVDFQCADGACAHAVGASAASPAICRGDTTRLTASVTGCPGTVAHRWRRDGNDIPGATQDRYDLPPTLPEGSFRFEVAATCTVQASCTMVSDPLVVDVASVRASVSNPSPQAVCSGAALAVDGSASSQVNCPAGLAYQWVLDGADVPGETAWRYDLPPTPGAGDHRIELRVSCASIPGCSDLSAPLLVSVTRVTASLANPTPVLACAGDRVDLDGRPSLAENCPGGPAYQWLLSGSEIPGATAPTYRTPALGTGTHDYALRVTCLTSPACASTTPVLPVLVSSGTATGVEPNSLVGVKSAPGAAAFGWRSSASRGNWNLHRTALVGDIASLWQLPPAVGVASPAASDATAPPAPGRPWYYRVFGADCRGASVP